MVRLRAHMCWISMAFLAASAGAQTELAPTYGQGRLKFAAISGTKLAYIETGSGVPVVLVHGAFSDYRYWAAQLETNTDGLRIIAYSRRDFHPNAHDSGEALQTGDRDVADLIEFVEALDISPVHLVGHSAGGHTALLAAIRRPDLVRSLVLEEGGFVADHPSSMQALAETEPVIERYARYRAAGLPEAAVEHFIDFVSGEGYFASASPVVRRMLLDNESAFGLRPNSRLTCGETWSVELPVLVVLGEHSPPYMDRLMSGLLHCLRDARTVTIPGASHGVHYEQPEAFNRAVFGFITAH